MKRAIALIAAAALALAVFVGANIYLRDVREDFELSAQTLCGSPEEAGGASVSLSASLQGGHYVWNVEHVAGEGSSSELSWHYTVPHEEYAVPMRLGIRPWSPINMSWSGGGRYYDFYGQEDSLEARIVNDVIEDMGAGESWRGEVYLSDYTDHWPVLAEGVNIAVAGAPEGYISEYDVSDVFHIPLEGEPRLDIEVRLYDDGGDVNMELYSDYSCAGSSSVYAADGNVYVSLLFTGAEGGFADASGVPGGSWGVYRIPCRTDEETGGVTAEVDDAELIFACAEGTSAMELNLSFDGSYVLICSWEPDGVWMNTYSTVTGEVTDRLRLGRETEYWPEMTALEGYLIFDMGEEAAVYAEEGGGWSFVTSLELGSLPAGDFENAEDMFSSYYSLWDCDGERICVLDSDIVAPDEVNYEQLYRFSVFGMDGELISCELLRAQASQYSVGGLFLEAEPKA